MAFCLSRLIDKIHHNKHQKKVDAAFEYVEKLAFDVDVLHKNLKRIMFQTPNVLDCIVYYLQLTTIFAERKLDAGIVYFVINKDMTLVSDLQRFQGKIGRNPEGINRTPADLQVSHEHVFLGGVFGVDEGSASSFKKIRDAKDVENMKIVCKQASIFMDTHLAELSRLAQRVNLALFEAKKLF